MEINKTSCGNVGIEVNNNSEAVVKLQSFRLQNFANEFLIFLS